MNWKRLSSTSIALCVCGLSIGWMVGLSASPVVQSVITTVLTLLTALAVFVATGVGPDRLLGVSAGEGDAARRVVPQNMRVLALGLVGILIGAVAIGSSLGVYARTNDWLGAHPATFVERWQLTGHADDEIALRLFDQLYPADSANHRAAKSPLRGQLFAEVAPDEYEELKAARGDVLVRLMKQSENEHVRKFTEACEGDEKCLRAAVEHLLQPKPE